PKRLVECTAFLFGNLALDAGAVVQPMPARMEGREADHGKSPVALEQPQGRLGRAAGVLDHLVFEVEQFLDGCRPICLLGDWPRSPACRAIPTSARPAKMARCQSLISSFRMAFWRGVSSSGLDCVTY